MNAVVDLPPVWGEKLTKGLLSQSHRDGMAMLDSPLPSIRGRSLRGSFRVMHEDVRKTGCETLIADFVFGEGKRSRLVCLQAGFGDGDIEVGTMVVPIRMLMDECSHPIRMFLIGKCTGHAAMRIAAEIKDSHPKAIGRLLLPHLLYRNYGPETASSEGLALWNEDGLVATFIAREKLDKHQRTYDAAIARQGGVLSAKQAVEVLRFHYSNPAHRGAAPFF